MSDSAEKPQFEFKLPTAEPESASSNEILNTSLKLLLEDARVPESWKDAILTNPKLKHLID